MTSEIIVRPADRDDATYIALHLRDGDRREAAAAGIPDYDIPRQTRLSVRRSDFANVVLVDGWPALLYGIGPSGFPGVGVAWMLSTDLIRKIRRDFLEGCAWEVVRMKERYSVLYNRVHKDNTLSIRWLKWLGFKLGSPSADGFIVFRG